MTLIVGKPDHSLVVFKPRSVKLKRLRIKPYLPEEENMKNYFISITLTVAFLVSQNLHAVREEKKESKEEAVKRIEAYKPSQRLGAYEAKKEAASEKAEKEFWSKKIEETKKEVAFWARVNQIGSAAASAPKTQEKSDKSDSLKGRQTRGSHEEVPVNIGGRTVKASASVEEKMNQLRELYDLQKDAPSKELLESTFKEVKGNKEAEEGFNKLLDIMVESKGDPAELLKGITKLTEKNKLDAKDTLEIMRATCPDRCVSNKGACRIAAQLWKQIAGVTLAGLTLTAFTLNDLVISEPQDGKQKVTLSFKPIKDPKGETVTKEIVIEDSKQAEEDFPATPQKSS